ncbi:transcription termination/antitermination NusG family protein [Virgibacillus ainsalahensis]
MSFFAVQVVSGSEIAVKEMLGKHLMRSGDNEIKSIYALETYTQTANELDFSELTEADITSYLNVQRLQTNLSNLRFAYDQMQGNEDTGSLNMIVEYRQQIKDLTTKLKNLRNKSKKIESVLKGYILIELDSNFHYLPKHLWHLIKSIPKVTGFPSRMNIPQHEIDTFFEETEMSAEVELQFNEILSYEKHVQMQNDLLQQANQSNKLEEEKVLVHSIDDMNTDVTAEINTLKQTHDSMIDCVKAFIKNKRETVTMPVILFQKLYHEVLDNNILPDQLSSPMDLIQRLKLLLYKGEVMLE